MQAIDSKYAALDDFALIDELSRLSHTRIPAASEEIRTAPVLHDLVIEVDEMREAVKRFLGIIR